MLFYYPLNLLLLFLAAGTCFYLGFLSVTETPRSFFVQQSLIAMFLWVGVAFTSGMSIGYYMLGCALMAAAAWRQFRLQKDFFGKMWLSGAAAFGGTFCLLMLIGVPTGAPQGAVVWFVTAAYFGGFVLVTLHMVTMITLAATRKQALPLLFLERGFYFVFLTLALRAVMLVAMVVLLPRLFGTWGAAVIENVTGRQATLFYASLALAIFVPALVIAIALQKLKKGAAPATLLWVVATAEVSALVGEFFARRLFF